ncbi:MAG: class I SAM-dependent methyltransferase [Desulfobacterales bacterium]|nr:class I SAM-dependent methyltransferase [Desulfobacterales bacterium]
MNPEEYKTIAQLENSHWWYKSLHRLVIDTMRRIHPCDNTSIILLDAGCGTGGVLNALQKIYPLCTLIGADLSPLALIHCQNRGNMHFLQASVEHMPLDNESVDIVISLDVLYHMNVNDDEKSLKEMCRVTKRGGHLVLNLPAFEFLRGDHDRVVWTRDRYTRIKLCKKIQKSGFEILKCSYRHMILFPVVYAKRLTDRWGKHESAQSDLKPLPFWLNGFFYFISQFENRIINYSNLPVGSSLFCLAKKP